ncbi:MAG TPA: peroxidase family protein [Lacipirellulaceae bacterium]|nr:peroxidase family protein [Lacipirellulaceae bacterium]
MATARAENRSYDGTGNNLVNPTWGVAGTDLVRLAPAAYDNGYSTPRGGLNGPTNGNPVLPNPRAISNSMIVQTGPMPNSHEMTDWVFQWGQFVDHDLDLTNPGSPAEEFDIPIPSGDPIFDPTSTGTQVMLFQRSEYDPTTGNGPGNPRQQINEITSFLDGSQVYGSSAARADALRSHVGGRLLTSTGNLLPLNTMGLPNGTGGPGDPTQYYVAGDVRVDEQVGLTSIQTLFMREHNRLADQIASQNPTWSDDQIYQRARKLVGAEIESITYNEFLPALLGSYAPSVVDHYNPNVNASITTEFSTVLFRVGHTMLSPNLLRIQNDGTPAPEGPMALKDAFFVPQSLSSSPNELEYMLKGLASDQQQNIDMHLVDGVRDFLFGEPIPGGFDLASLNIQRGRDHGIPDYNTVREAFGLAPKTSFDQISSDPAVAAGLQALYGNVNNIDAWVGALAEDHYGDSQMGELLTVGLVDQFTKVRDGDRLWFLNDPDFSASDINWLMNLKLSDVIRANTGITNLQSNVFFMPAAVPEPATISIALFALCALVSIRRPDMRPQAR